MEKVMIRYIHQLSNSLTRDLKINCFHKQNKQTKVANDINRNLEVILILLRKTLCKCFNQNFLNRYKFIYTKNKIQVNVSTKEVSSISSF